MKKNQARTKNHTISLRMGEQMYNTLSELAELHGVSIPEVVRQGVSKAFNVKEDFNKIPDVLS